MALGVRNLISTQDHRAGRGELTWAERARGNIDAADREEILKRVKPILEYEREGGLYLADITLSSFTRPDQQK